MTKKPVLIIIVSSLIISLLVIYFLFVPGLIEKSYSKKAEELYNNHDYNEALECLKKGIEKYPESEYLSYLLLKTINTSYLFTFSSNEHASLYPVINNILDNYQDCENAELLTEVGYSLWLNNDHEKAKKCLEKALEINPDYYLIYNYLGNFNYESNFPKAIEYYNRLFAFKPESLNFIGLVIVDDYIFEEIVKNKTLKKLFLSSSNYAVLKGISELYSLEVLSLIGQEISNLQLKHLISNLKNLKVLSLFSNRIERLEGFNNLTNLSLLYLNNNLIHKIERLDNLTKLKGLYLQRNNISKLENLDKMVKLQNLNIKNNQITIIENLDNLTKLKKLDLSSNQISNIENLTSLSSLEILNLSYNNISKLENLDHQVNLQELDLNNCKQIKKLENLDNLKKLKKLNLQYNQINKIENISNLKKLQDLELRNNQISKLENLDGLRNLRNLYLSHNNKISRLENLDKLTKLQSIYLTNNEISKIENLDRLTRLEQLYLGSNKIIRIENLDKLTKLHTLYLSNNQIKKLENLDNLKSLQMFNLGTNQVNKLENLDGLSNLKILDLYGNQIYKLENLENLASLEYLYLSKNLIGTKDETVLKIPALSSLKGLMIHGPEYSFPGNIQYIKGIENCPNLEEFNFSYQNLLELPDFSNLKKLKRLHIEKSVNLPKFQFNKIPVQIKSLTLWNVNLENLEGIEKLINLEELWLGDNVKLTSLSNLNEIATLKSLNVSLCKGLPIDELLRLDNIKTIFLTMGQYPEKEIGKLKEKGMTIIY